jgi:beta-1,4-mannosyltransferase
MFGRQHQRANHDLTVLVSFRPPRATTNPYITMLSRSLRDEPGIRLRNFGWRVAIAGRYDVFHVHWPELLLAGRNRMKRAGRQLLFVLFLGRLWITRIPVVRTLHNIQPHENDGRVERFLLRLLDRRTVGWIRLNPSTESPDPARTVTILHGHYVDWFAEYEQPTSRPGNIVFAGLIREYKNIPALISAFSDLVDPSYRLRIVGSPSTEQLAASLSELAGSDRRVSVCFGYVADAQLAAEVAQSELVVLPYKEMHNSGAALMALSLNRPILAPDNEITRMLADEVGHGWVYRYQSDLSANDIAAAIDGIRARPFGVPPELSARGWDEAGSSHLAIYQRAQDFRWRGRAHR